MVKFYVDIDGVMLNLEKVMRSCLMDELDGEKRLRLVLGPSMTWCYFMEEAYGLPSSVVKKMFDRVWNTPAKLYLDAQAFVKALQAKDRYEVIGLSYRPSTESKKAAFRDLDGLGLNDLILIDNPKDKHVYFKEGVKYVDDHPNYAANAGELGAETFLITRDWNLRCRDIGNYYTRVDTLRELNEKV